MSGSLEPSPNFIELAYANPNFRVLETAPCWMTYGERLFLYSLIASLRPKRYLEIGTARGGSAIVVKTALTDAAVSDAEMYLIDMKFDIAAGDLRYLGPNVKRFEGDSREKIAEASSAAGAPFDLVLIDGDHSYQGAKRDILAVHDHVRPGGYVLLHDAYNLEIGQAIREGIREAPYLDCGLLCTHGNDMENKEFFPEGGPYAGKPLHWGGLYLLRKLS